MRMKYRGSLGKRDREDSHADGCHHREEHRRDAEERRGPRVPVARPQARDRPLAEQRHQGQRRTMPKPDRSPGLSSERPTSAASAMPSDARPTTAMRSEIETRLGREMRGRPSTGGFFTAFILPSRSHSPTRRSGESRVEITRSRRAPIKSRLATGYNPRHRGRKRNHVRRNRASVPVAVRKTSHLVFDSRAWHKRGNLRIGKADPLDVTTDESFPLPRDDPGTTCRPIAIVRRRRLETPRRPPARASDPPLAGYWIVQGDDNQDASIRLDYRKAGGRDGEQGDPLFRVERRAHLTRSTAAGSRSPTTAGCSPAASCFWSRHTAYEMKLTLTDPDGDPQPRTLQARTRAEPRAGPERRTPPRGAGHGGGTGTETDPFRGLEPPRRPRGPATCSCSARSLRGNLGPSARAARRNSRSSGAGRGPAKRSSTPRGTPRSARGRASPRPAATTSGSSISRSATRTMVSCSTTRRESSSAAATSTRSTTD